MTVSEYIAILRTAWRTLLGGLLLGIGVAAVIVLAVVPTYEATAKLYVATRAGSSPGDIYQAASVSQRVAQTYATLATTPYMLGPVKSRLHLATTANNLAGMVSAQVEAGGAVIDVTVKSESSVTAAKIANALSDEIRQRADALMPSTTGLQPSIETMPVEVAAPPARPSTPSSTLTIILGAAGGICAGLVLAVAAGAVRRGRNNQATTYLPLRRNDSV